MKKIGRNDPCPCGSGKKYKKCCLMIHGILENRFHQPPAHILDELNMKLLAERIKQNKYGMVRPIIQDDFDGNRFIAVGNELHYSTDWKTFPDFLMSYIKRLLGKEWGEAELKKPIEKRHEIMNWYDSMCRFQQRQKKGANGIYQAIPNGPMKAYLLLSYDLYVLRHHNLLQNALVVRLKNVDQFQGARHELFAAATCIRAGFLLEYENEADRSRKHPEFLATHEKTGQRVAVEAKSRTRPGILGRPGTKVTDGTIKLGIGRLLNKSLEKALDKPLVIFLDLNMPPSSVRLFEKPWINKLNSAVERIDGGSKEGAKYNLLVFSNMPFYYDESDNPSPKGDILT
ncbi:MAG: YecA family protein, partial [Candidatus Aminicenantales bacterium]